MYRVLQARPITFKTGEVTHARENGKPIELRWEAAVAWLERGTAYDMEDAKRRFGGAPVLVPIDSLH